ncbi:MAG: restriction endonuclease [Ramlibacter sp.]|nr:restriction endonuclease [Ramlibacter sp.]
MTSLSTYFKGTASKYLSAVDATPSSNQHEIGSNKFTAILGTPGNAKLRFKATFLFFNPDTEQPESCRDDVTYYDARLNQPHRAPEYRLYYKNNLVTEQLREGDFCLVGALTTGELLIAIARPGSEDERRVRYLFDIDEAKQQWEIDSSISTGDLDIASRSILDALGIEAVDAADEMLDRMVDKFGLRFPPTKEFSAFARETLGKHADPLASPDQALEEWMKQEERLFRSLERAIVSVQLEEPFETVDAFIDLSLSVQNRRKSRVGHALENHLEAIFKATGTLYQRGAKTEGNARPDFLFPSAMAYADPRMKSPPLRMLAAKSTCKDRWRQILAEAERIPEKHLFTLETAISKSQTDEMQAHRVQLVVPPSVKKTYSESQQSWLIGLGEFILLVR